MIAFAAHSLIRSYVLATLTAAVISTTVFQFVGYFRLGYLDPFFVVALAIGALLAAAIAAIIGIPFVRMRGKKKE